MLRHVVFVMCSLCCIVASARAEQFKLVHTPTGYEEYLMNTSFGGRDSLVHRVSYRWRFPESDTVVITYRDNRQQLIPTIADFTILERANALFGCQYRVLLYPEAEERRTDHGWEKTLNGVPKELCSDKCKNITTVAWRRNGLDIPARFTLP